MDDWDGREPTWEQQGNVNKDLKRIVGYSEGCPDEFGGSWLGDDGSYGVTFTGSLDTHTRRLQDELIYPERLRAGNTAHSLKELEGIGDQIRTAARSQESLRAGLSGWGVNQRHGVVQVRVLVNRPDVAAQLAEWFGQMIEIEFVTERPRALPHI